MSYTWSRYNSCVISELSFTMSKSLIVLLFFCFCCSTLAFHHHATLPSFATRIKPQQQQQTVTLLYATSSEQQQQQDNAAPQVFACGYSPKLDLYQAIQEATEMALEALPIPKAENAAIDFAFITVSSLYDGQSQPSIVVPAVLESASSYGRGVQNLVGCTTGGIIASTANYNALVQDTNGDDDDDDDTVQQRACTTIESEGVPGVSVTLCLLPDVNVKTFHVLGEDVPDDVGRISQESFQRAVGLGRFEVLQDENETITGPPAFMLIPSPAFQNDLDDLLLGLQHAFPSSTAFGGIASTVSSLSRARLFRYDVSDPQCIQTLADGCVGVAMQGDLEVKSMIAQGAKPVGGIYRVVTGSGSTIKAIVLDEAVEEEDDDDEENEDEVDEEVSRNAKAIAAAAYEKARIPKPPLAEANFVMKTLSDDDRAYMRKALLVGLERGGAVGRTPNELARLAEGQGHRFTVQQVASAGMKDGSITLPLESVDVQPGTRMRFFVRESDFAKKEVEALWMGYKKKALTNRFETEDGEKNFNPSGCILLPTLDRGSKFFGGKPGYESGAVAEFLPSIPCVSGYFSNGVLGRLSDSDAAGDDISVFGSSSSYVLLGSKSGRPIYSPSQAEADEAEADRKKAEKDAADRALAEEDEKRKSRAQSPLDLHEKAPRDENGELILRRREIHSGRAISVSTVEWSVAEKTATPTSVLEGFMWDKEAEVDRFRERVPLANLVSQCRLSSMDPTKPKPRDWASSIRMALSEGDGFVVVPECKRMDPASGSLRKRYDLSKLVKQFTKAGAPTVSINCDGVLFGGSLDDLRKAREASGAAAVEISDSEGVIVPPVLASDLILYPYQLYQLRLGGADAVNLMTGALARKDLLYLTKIAASLQLQTLATVTSETQINDITDLSAGSISALIISNRELEDFSFDMTGEQALNLLKSDALKKFRKKHGDDVPILVEGRVGIIEATDDGGKASAENYIKALKEAGASGAIIGGGLAVEAEDAQERLESLMS